MVAGKLYTKMQRKKVLIGVNYQKGYYEWQKNI